MNPIFNLSRWEKFVSLYLVLRTVLWTILLFLTQPELPLDVLEHLAWGREWYLVYAHHPGLPAWINEILNLASGGSHLALSVTAPIATSAGMLAVWTLARRMVSDKHAAVAALSLEGLYYFNVAATEFNHNILQLAVCAWLCVFAHKAFLGKNDLDKNATSTWITLGIFAALSLYAKYSSVLFIFALLLWTVSEPLARTRWKTLGPWLAFAVFIALTIPQIFMLLKLQFAPFQFALERATAAHGWTDHIVYPLRFLVAQLAAVLLAMILCRGAMSGGRFSFVMTENRRFVLFIAFVPLLQALLISAIEGLRFRSLWGTGMLSFIPLCLIMFVIPHSLNMRRWKIGLFSVALLAAIVVTTINIGAPYLKERGKRIHYPGAMIGHYVEQTWQTHYPDIPLRFVIGSKHIASLISFYAPSRPSAILDNDWKKNFWATPEDFSTHGGVIAWMINDGKHENIPLPKFVKNYPTVRRAKDLSIRWQTSADIPPLKIGVLLVPPKILTKK